MKRLKQAQRADRLLALTREQRLQAVGIDLKSIIKPLSVKLVRLSEQDVRSHSSRSVPADEDSGSGDSDDTITASLQLCDEVDSACGREYASVGCGGDIRSDVSSKRGASEAAASVTDSVDAVVQHRSKVSRKVKSGSDAAIRNCENLEVLRGGLTGKGEESVPSPVSSTQSKPSITQTVLPRSQCKKQGRRGGPYAKNIGVVDSVGGGDKQSGVSSKRRASEAATSVSDSVDEVIRRIPEGRKHEASFLAALDLQGSRDGVTGNSMETLPSALSSTQSSLMPAVSETVLSSSQCKIRGCQDRSNAINSNGCCGEKQSAQSTKRGADEATVSAAGSADAVVRRTSKKSRKPKAGQNLHSAEQSCDLEASVIEHSSGLSGKNMESIPSTVSSTQSSVLPSIKETVLPPCQYGNAPDTRSCQTSTDQDRMTPSVSSNSKLSGARKTSDDGKLADKESVPTEDQSATLASVRCGITASSTTVTESHQFSTGTSDRGKVRGRRGRPYGSRRARGFNRTFGDLSHRTVPDGTTGSDRINDLASSDTTNDYGAVRGRRGRPYGSRRRPYGSLRARGVDRTFGDLSHRTVPDGTTGSDMINDVASSDTTNDRGAVRGRRGRPYSSRRARGTRQSFTNPPHHSVPSGTGCDTDTEDMTSGAYTGYLPQYCAAVAHDVSWMQQDLPVSATGYAGETKHTIIVIYQSDLYSSFVFPFGGSIQCMLHLPKLPA